MRVPGSGARCPINSSIRFGAKYPEAVRTNITIVKNKANDSVIGQKPKRNKRRTQNAQALRFIREPKAPAPKCS